MFAFGDKTDSRGSRTNRGSHEQQSMDASASAPNESDEAPSFSFSGYFADCAPALTASWSEFSLNNPGRFQLMDLAEDFQKRAKELETKEEEQQQSKPYKAE